MPHQPLPVVRHTAQPMNAVLVDDLREKILTGEIEPGTHLRQDAVAEAYGVSTTPVREAFVCLYSEGLLLKVPYKGAIVFKPTVEELDELYTIRLMIEPAATRLAVPNLTNDDLVALEFHMDEMRRLSQQDGDRASDELHEQNQAFHGRIYDATGLPRLTSLIEQLRGSSLVYIRMFSQTVRGALVRGEGTSYEEHDAIYRALVSKSEDDAAEATAVHLRHTLEVVRAVLLVARQKPAAAGHSPAGSSADAS